ncbi:glucoamylase family protein [Sphingobacterium composti Ten et al. 2007 non Yoo et al. 2007]|uniref:glucoamylase family protein n=1 Tax=Sphingobacterium composti TaxID=363260 RepID=UPI001357110C|nr:glucoamylase family protein [Sphingobacterium composti Ten et al. 2007 non Yoo et al. 2007]
MRLLFIYIVTFGLFLACKAPDHAKHDTHTQDSLLTKIQQQTFKYFWEGAEPVSGLARERIHMDGEYPQNDKDVITIGGSGFGLMGILIAEQRKFIQPREAQDRFKKSLTYLSNLPRFQGAFAHWYEGPSGKVKAFGDKDNGGDIVETAFLAQALICVREYYKNGTQEQKEIAALADKIWKEINWKHYTNGKDVIYWHWSPEHRFGMNHPIQGFDECLITYVLAASSPTFPIEKQVYDRGWARNGQIKTTIEKYGFPTEAKHNAHPGEVGPLFWSHYSFLGLNPNGLKDKYVDYDKVVHNHTQIHIEHAKRNPNNFVGYGAEKGWGLTASYSVSGYDAHHPNNDKGVISPTAALSSIPYAPKESISFANYLFNNLESKVWGEYGFYDAYSETANWFPQRYLAIDQGPIVVMIENYRSQFIWNLFMNAPEIKEGLRKLNFQHKQ